MDSFKDFMLGIISGLIISILGAFILNPSITVELEPNSNIILYDIIPHYEFSSDDAAYLENLDINYKIKTPFHLFNFNSVVEITKPDGYVPSEKILDYSEDCISLAQTDKKLVITAKVDQFKIPECAVKIRYVRVWKKNELVNVKFNSSWKRTYEGNRLREEEGIVLTNRMNVPIKNYIFVYNQTNLSQITKQFKACNELKIYLNQQEVLYRDNFFDNNSLIAVELDFAPKESKDFIIICHQSI